MLTAIMMQGIRRTKVRDIELNEYWSGGLSASQSCSAGQPPDQVPARVWESANAATGPHLKVRESIGKDMGRSYTLVPVAAEKDQLAWLGARCCQLRSSNEINPARNPIASPNHDERT